MIKRCALAFSLLAFFFADTLSAAFDSSTFNTNKTPLQILRIIPSGEDVPPERQVVFTFNRPVVPIGRMERESTEIPIEIKPALNCQWRWLDTTSLACQLDEKDKLTPATRYTITIEPGITTVDGSTIEESISHTFITERPKIINAWFKTWTSPQMPHININFEQPVKQASIEKHLYMSTASDERINITASEDEDYKKYSEEEDEDYKNHSDDKYGRRWVVSPEEELPSDERIELWVEPGIVSTEGKEKGVEDKVIVEFHTFPEFRFIGVRCVRGEGHYRGTYNRITYSGNEDLKNMEKCDPLNWIGLLFSSPVDKDDIKEHLIITPDIRGGRTDYDPWGDEYNSSYRLSRPHNKGDEYDVVFPEILKANETYHVRADAGKIKDMFGRTLKDPIDIKFLTDHRRPDYHLSSNFFVLEKNIDSEVPLVITNLNEITFDYKTLTSRGISKALKKTLTLDKVEDIAYKIPLKTRDMIPALSGILYAQFKTTPHVSGDDWFFSQVTPYNVHVKIGHFNTIVWVTDFSTGMPVEGVTVDIYKDTIGLFTGSLGPLVKTITNAKGIAILPGTEKIDPNLDLLNPREWDLRKGARLFVRCQKGTDMAIVPLIYSFEVEQGGYYEDETGYRAYTSRWSKRKYGHIHTWGTTAQGIYRAGDTVNYKFYVRNQDNTGFIQPPVKLYNLKVIDPLDRTVYEKKDIVLSAFGSYDGEFIIPKTGAVGWYRFVLSSNFAKDDEWEPMRVLVSDFTPAPFKVLTELEGEFFNQGDIVKIVASARLHAGGPYTNASARITATLKRRYFVPKAAAANKFTFDVYDYNNAAETIYQTESNLDDKGDLASEFKIGPTEILYGNLIIESAVRDDRGKYVANQASAAFAGRDRYVGIHQGDWVIKEGSESKVSAFVVDQYGNPQENTAIELTIEYRKTTASRVKGAGNAYIAQYNHEWVNAASCELTSKQEPVDCVFTPANAGTYRMTAKINDTLSRPHSSSLWRWAVGKGLVLWETPPDNTLNIFPEKQDYSVGEVAKYLVQNPFPGATALITIERYGIIKSWIKTFKNSMEIIEFPVIPEYIPGYYLSVVVTSPRVQAPIGENDVDLGKPSFKIGYVRVDVKDPYKEILINVKPEKEVYRPRDTVKVNIEAKLRQPVKTQPPMELAVAVLDEAVFDLLSAGRNYFDLYKGFYYLEPLDVKNYAILMELVGRQKFEKKGATAGGDGGFDISMRSIFKFVSYWNPSVKTDRSGRAAVEFEAPDNLTGWKVLVMAVNETDRMGLGDSIFKVNRPTEVRPALPNQATEGDSFTAGFTVMNRTESTRTLKVEVRAEGATDKITESADAIIAEPYKRYMVWLPVKTKGYGEINFNVIAGDSQDRDGLSVSMPVLKRASLETAAAYGTMALDSVSESIAFPKDMRTDIGSVSITAAPTVIGNVEGAFSYLRDYPYMCWEQQLTKGVMASHYLNLKQYLPEDFKWEEARALPEKTIALARQYQAPNGGMTYYRAEDMYVSPYLSAYTALGFNWLGRSGYSVPEDVENRLHNYLVEMLRRDVFPSFYSKGIASTVRAVALSALSEHKKIPLQDILRYRQHVPEMSLFGKAHYLKALVNASSTENVRREVADMILSHANVTGGKFIFSETIDLGYERIHSSELRDNCAVLSALISYYETPNGEKTAGDVPFKLVRTITETRGGNTYWENTQENIFCMNALINFSRVYEKEKPDMTLKAWFDAESMGQGRFTDLRDREVLFERPIQKGDPGRASTVKLERKGSGRVYYSTRLSYAPLEPKRSAINSGIEVRREYSVERGGKWVLLGADDAIKTGELVKVDIYVSLPAARNFVVLDDPIPGGLESVNKDLATASAVDAGKGAFKRAKGSFWFTRSDWFEYGYTFWSFYHMELRHHAARFYSEYLPSGNYHLSYTAQAIAPGDFIVMPSHAEEMYNPDVFGKSAPSRLMVERP